MSVGAWSPGSAAGLRPPLPHVCELSGLSPVTHQRSKRNPLTDCAPVLELPLTGGQLYLLSNNGFFLPQNNGRKQPFDSRTGVMLSCPSSPAAAVQAARPRGSSFSGEHALSKPSSDKLSLGPCLLSVPVLGRPPLPKASPWHFQLRGNRDVRLHGRSSQKRPAKAGAGLGPLGLLPGAHGHDPVCLPEQVRGPGNKDVGPGVSARRP